MSLLKFIPLFFFLSCTNYADYELKDGRLELSLESAKVNRVNVIEWGVGENESKTLSKGVEVQITLPKLSKDLMEKIFGEYNADSWGVRINKVTATRSQTIAHLYTPFISRSESNRLRARSQSPGSLSFRLFYPAAAVSGRLEGLSCPAFNHRYLIERADIQNVSRSHKITVSAHRQNRVRGDIREIGYFPMTLNAGSRLEGRYEVELGIYDSSSQKFRSDLRPISDQVRIASEVNVSVPECEGVRVEPRQGPSNRPFENFQFGR